MVRYSREMKEAMVKKLCLPGAPSALQLSKKIGIPQASLSRWVRQFGGEVTQKKRRPEDWSPEERLLAVFESQGLGEQELGEFLRKNGLHSHHLEEWKKDALSGLTPQVKRTRGRPKKDPELASAQNEIKLLKRDLRRKDRALAEQTALVILQKKVIKNR